MDRKILSTLLLITLCMTLSPARAVFIGDSAGDLWELDVSTNTRTFIGNSGLGAFFDIAQDPTSGNLYGVTGGGTFASIDTATGAGTILGSTGGAFINGLTFDSSGTLFGSGGTGLYTLSLASGNAALVGSTGFNSSGDIAFDSSGNLYMSASGATDSLVLLNASTGSGSLIGNTGFSSVFGLNYSGSTLYGFTLGRQTISINTTTGAGTLLADNGIRANGADGAGGVVPEPSIVALFGAGLFGLVFARRRMAG